MKEKDSDLHQRSSPRYADTQRGRSEGPTQEGRHLGNDDYAEYQELIKFFRACMSPEAFTELEREIDREIKEGAKRLGISDTEYIRNVGISYSPKKSGRNKGVRF